MTVDPAMRPWATPGEPGATRYLCPEDCGWFYDTPPITAYVDPDPAQSFATLDEAISEIAFETVKRHMLEVEAAVREHLNEHTAAVMLSKE